jgi:hypothetical protein
VILDYQVVLLVPKGCPWEPGWSPNLQIWTCLNLAGQPPPRSQSLTSWTPVPFPTLKIGTPAPFPTLRIGTPADTFVVPENLCFSTYHPFINTLFLILLLLFPVFATPSTIDYQNKGKVF